MRVGGNAITAAYLGSTAISRAYLGAVQVFDGVAPPASSAPRYIVDTDFAGDPDDPLAFAILIDAHKAGVINLIGVVVSSTVETSAPGVRALLNAYGLSSVPVYAYQGAVGTYNNTYSAQLRDRFGVPGQTRADFVDDVTGYKLLLNAAPDASVKIIGIGGLTSLSRLLADSPALIASKVISLTQMAGTFLSSSGTPEYNMTRDIAGSQNIFTNWPASVPILMHGSEIGGSIFSGPGYGADPLVDPIKYAFDLGQSAGLLNSALKRQSWDPIAVHYAIYGPRSAYGIGGANGSVTIDGAGNNAWSASPAGNVSYATRIAGTQVLGRELDRITAAVDISNPAPDSDNFLFNFTEGTGRRSVGPNPNDIAYFGWESLTQIPAWSAGVGPDFDGGDVAWVKHRPSYASQDIAFAAVVNLDSVAASRVIAARADGSGRQYWNFRLNAGRLEFVLFNNAGTGFTATAPVANITTGTNTLVSFLLTGGDTLTIRRNGVQVHTATLGAKMNSNVTDGRLLLGARINASEALADFMDGRYIAAGYKAGASAADLTNLETAVQGVATAKGLTIP